MAVGFSRSQGPAHPGAIEQVESRLGIELPQDYRRFLQTTNGGVPKSNFLPPEANASARYLYSAGPNDDEYLEDLESIAHLYSADGEVDDETLPGFLPIGEDDGSNLVCLKVTGEDYGAVYFWSHEMSEPEQAYTRIADSFEEFFDRLRPDSEMDRTT